MIIHFSDSVDRLNAAEPEDLEFFVSELLRSSMVGNHYVVIDKPTGDWIVNNVVLPSRHKAQLRLILSQFSERVSLYRKSIFCLDIAIGHTPLEKIRDGKYCIGHLAILKSNLFDKTALSVENLSNDGEVIKSIIDIICIKHEVRNVSFELKMGGGSAISSSFEQSIMERRPSSVIVDSDKIYPSDVSSSVFKSLLRISENYRFVGFVRELPCRDIENLIPVSMIKDLGSCPDYNDIDFSFLMSLVVQDCNESAKSCPLLFFDMKEGLCPVKVSRLHPSSPKRKWIEEIFSRETALVKIPGFGENVLSSVMSHKLFGKNLKKLVSDPQWRARFSEFFNEIVWYLAADKRNVV